MQYKILSAITLAVFLTGCNQTTTNQYATPTPSVAKPRVLAKLKRAT